MSDRIEEIKASLEEIENDSRFSGHVYTSDMKYLLGHIAALRAAKEDAERRLDTYAKIADAAEKSLKSYPPGIQTAISFLTMQLREEKVRSEAAERDRDDLRGERDVEARRAQIFVEKTNTLTQEVERFRQKLTIAQKWLKYFIDEHGAEHEDPSCPEDDTCVCENIEELNDACKALSATPAPSSSDKDTIARLRAALERVCKDRLPACDPEGWGTCTCRVNEPIKSALAPAPCKCGHGCIEHKTAIAPHGAGSCDVCPCAQYTPAPSDAPAGKRDCDCMPNNVVHTCDYTPSTAGDRESVIEEKEPRNEERPCALCKEPFVTCVGSPNVLCYKCQYHAERDEPDVETPK